MGEKLHKRMKHPHKFLDKNGQTYWKKLYPILEKKGHLADEQLEGLATLCQCWSEYLLATEQLNREGRTTVSKTGLLHKHPCCELQRIALDQHTRLAKEFGLTPRSRLDHGKAPIDELDEFLGG